MANMTTSLTEFADNGNSRTYAAPLHTVQAPRLVIQRRTVPATANGVSESSLKVVFGTIDALGVALPQKVSFEAVPRFPVGAKDTDVDSALALFREMVASDNFTKVVKSQLWLQA